MAEQSHTISRQTLDAFGEKLATWASTLDPTQQAMLIDLLAKAGGDVYGNTAADRLASPADEESDASELSALELRDFKHAVEGIFKAGEVLTAP